MKASHTFISTLKEAPADAEVKSHQLMMRAGMIKRLSAGIYNYMPLGLRVIRKVEAIIRDEMNRAGGVELLMPVVQPAELWQETGRFQVYGPELLRIKDRHDRDFVLQPTSEEVITDIARQELRSYKQLPRNWYHIQTKFRDERRPRFGLMRGREFTMKDAYSFDRDKASALVSYQRMYDAYCAIFDRFGLQYRAVAADTGSIGGDASHEFQVIAETGEDAIAYCPTSSFAANVELAEALPLIAQRAAPSQALAKTPTPGKSTCEDVATLLGLPLPQTVKSLVLATEEKNDTGDIVKVTVWLLLVRGDHSLNEVKTGKVPGLKDGWRFATVAEIESHFGTKPGYLGPIGTKKPVKVVAERTVANMSDFVCGANEADFHYTGVNWGRDLPEPDLVADIRNVVAGDPSPDGKGVLAIQRGIESHFGTKPGYLGAIGTKKPVKVVAERTVANMSDFVCGANEADFHFTGVNWGRDLPEPDLVADIRNVVAGDPSPDGKGVLAIQRGIEVGHVFYLGTKKYSVPMNANFLDENGKPQPFEMGCYGIGVTRILGAAIEQGHDERGIIWPAAIAPFAAVVCPIGYDRNAEVKAAADALHDELVALGVDVVLDDRGERPGVMFAEWELIGIPQRVVISERGLKAGTVELQGRREAAASAVPVAEVAALLKGRIEGLART